MSDKANGEVGATGLYSNLSNSALCQMLRRITLQGRDDRHALLGEALARVIESHQTTIIAGPITATNMRNSAVYPQKHQRR